jgi:hypothetical protein
MSTIRERFVVRNLDRIAARELNGLVSRRLLLIC